MKKKQYVYQGFQRFWHWSQAILIFFLALTGFEVHGSYKIFGFEEAVIWHERAAWGFIILIVFTIFWHFVTGAWRHYIPTTQFLTAQFKYYVSGIFKGAPHPVKKTIYNKFNPLQRFTYLGLKLLVIPVQVTTGLLYMYFHFAPGHIQMDGLGPTAILHTAGAFFLLMFAIAHVYLITTNEDPKESFKGMVTGWEEVDDDKFYEEDYKDPCAE